MKKLKDGQFYFIRWKGKDEWTVGRVYVSRHGDAYFFRVGSECEEKADLWDIGRRLTLPVTKDGGK